MRSETQIKVIFLISLVATAGSLFFSEVMKLPPCSLCWYQRICLIPVLIISGVAIWHDDQNYRKFILPFIFGGLGLSLYHNLLYFGFISEALAPCTQDLSCTAKQIEIFGFITIPLLSFLTFLMITLILFFRAGDKNEK